MIGKVEKIKFTVGSPFGNQFTTINGVKYMTWWDIRQFNLKEGVTVEHEPHEYRTNLNGSDFRAMATIIKAIVPDAPSQGLVADEETVAAVEDQRNR